MSDFEKLVREYLENAFDPGTKNWNDYESAKALCLFNCAPNDSEQYDLMIKIITEWLEL